MSFIITSLTVYLIKYRIDQILPYSQLALYKWKYSNPRHYGFNCLQCQLDKVKDSPQLVDDTTRGCQTNAGEYSLEYIPCRFLNNLYPMSMFRTNSGGVVTFM